MTSKVELPEGYVPPPLERVPGGADSTGERLPGCQPEWHKEDGKHGFGCIGGIWGYRETSEGDFERIPPHALSVPGATWTYSGGVYVRPVQRGASLDDDSDFAYVEDLPEGYYDVDIRFVRRQPEPQS